MPIDWAPFVDLVRRGQRFLLTTHVRPDGDGLGSLLALTDALEHRDKHVRMVVASSLPPRYEFLAPPGRIQRFTAPGDAWRDVDTIIVLDTGTWNQLDDFGPFLKSMPAAKAVIDHHLTQDDLGALRFVDTSAEATGRLVHEAIMALGGPLTGAAASNLFVALAMDTGWFRHSNATAPTFDLAAQLARAGAKPTAIYDELFERNSLARLKLMGRVLERLRVCESGQVAHTDIRLTDYLETSATTLDSEDLVNFTRSVMGVEVGLLFMEQPRGGVKVSFRSRSSIDVARIAEQFGGGGHRLASGAVVDASLDQARARVLEAVKTALADNARAD
jgi:phosphoesterase RecJ-like protein